MTDERKPLRIIDSWVAGVVVPVHYTETFAVKNEFVQAEQLAQLINRQEDPKLASLTIVDASARMVQIVCMWAHAVESQVPALAARVHMALIEYERLYKAGQWAAGGRPQ